MKKLMYCLCVLLMSAIFIAGCGVNSGEKGVVFSKQDSDLDYVVNKGKLVVGVTDFEPLDYMENGEWTGFDADMAKLFGESLGVSVEFMEIEWDAKTKLLNDGVIDCVWNGMTLSEDVMAEMSCSVAFLNNSQIIVMPEQMLSQYNTVEECTHFLFAVESGSAGEEEIGARHYRYNAVSSQREALESVNTGKADAAVIDAIMAGAMVGEGNEFADLMYTNPLNSEQYGVGFRQNSDLTEKLNTFLKEKYSDGTLTEIAEKYGVQAALIPFE